MQHGFFFLFVSMYHHHPTPNTHKPFHIHPNKKTQNKTKHTSPAAERQAALQATYGFACRCPACLGYHHQSPDNNDNEEEEKVKPEQQQPPLSASASASAASSSPNPRLEPDGQQQEQQQPPLSASSSSPPPTHSQPNQAQQPQQQPQQQQQPQRQRHKKWTVPDRARAFTCPVDDCDGPVCPFGVGGEHWSCIRCGRDALPLEVRGCVGVGVVCVVWMV
jgi:hypothetical protein